jgi:Bacterial membrane protein YfhO
MSAMTLLVLSGLIWLGLMARLRRRNPVGLWLDLLAGGLLFLLTLGFFWRTISGDVYQPADGGDLVSFLFPTYRFAAEQIRQWTLPLWNPHLYGGAPFISDIQAGFLYPPNLLLFFFNPQFDYPVLQWLAIGHFYWAGLGMYVLLRTLTWGESLPLSRPAAFLGALAFQCSDPFLIHLGNLNLIAVLSWLPWVMAAYHRGLRQRSLRWTALAALAFAVGNYAGHAQSSLYIGMAVAVYTVIWLFMEQQDWRLVIRDSVSFAHQPKSLITNLQYPVILLILTLLLTAPILLPAIELTGYTARSNFVYQDTVGYSLAPTQVIGLLTPGFFGHGPALHWSLWQRVETPYAGVVTLILAVAGIALVSAEQRRRLLPWIGLALVGFVTALGIYALFHGWLTLLPGFGQLRAPARALILWTFSLAILAATGLDAIRNSAPSTGSGNDPRPLSLSKGSGIASFLKTGGFILLGIFTPLLYLALLITQYDPVIFTRASVAALAVTLATGCWLVAWFLIRARQAAWIGGNLFAGLIIALLFFELSATSAYTDISPTPPTQGFQHPELVAFLQNDPDRFRIDTRTDIASLWQPDTAALHGLQDVGGIANPLLLRHWQEFWEATGGRQSQQYDQLNVKYVIVRDGTPLPEGKFALALDAPGELSVYRNQGFLPRAWLADGQADLAQLAPLANAPDATVTHYGANELTVTVQPTAPAYLVLSEIWYPGWQATVNGAPVEVLRANQALRAVALPAGTATVRLWFAPRSWQIGLGAALVGLLLCVVCLVKS